MPLVKLAARAPLARSIGCRQASALFRQSAAGLSIKATRPARAGDPGYSPGFYVVEDEPPDVLEMAPDGKTPLVVAPRVELTLEWLVESPPPEHTWEEPPIFYDVDETDSK